MLVVEAGGAGGVVGRAGTVVGAGGRGSGTASVACGSGTVVVVVVVDVDVDVDIAVVEPGVMAGRDWTTPASASTGVVVI